MKIKFDRHSLKGSFASPVAFLQFCLDEDEREKREILFSVTAQIVLSFAVCSVRLCKRSE